MSMSKALSQYLEDQARPYELTHHPRTFTSMETAAAAHVPGDQLAKAVVVEDEADYALVVIPSTHRLLFSTLKEHFGHQVGLATEEEIEGLFKDCELGSIPALGDAYGLRVLIDETLLAQDNVYFEAGDHTELVHMFGEDFRALMSEATQGRFGQHV